MFLAPMVFSFRSLCLMTVVTDFVLPFCGFEFGDWLEMSQHIPPQPTKGTNSKVNSTCLLLIVETLI